jgi:hypothetical protein
MRIFGLHAVSRDPDRAVTVEQKIITGIFEVSTGNKHGRSVFLKDGFRCTLNFAPVCNRKSAECCRFGKVRRYELAPGKQHFSHNRGRIRMLQAVFACRHHDRVKDYPSCLPFFEGCRHGLYGRGVRQHAYFYRIGENVRKDGVELGGQQCRLYRIIC